MKLQLSQTEKIQLKAQIHPQLHQDLLHLNRQMLNHAK